MKARLKTIFTRIKCFFTFTEVKKVNLLRFIAVKLGLNENFVNRYDSSLHGIELKKHVRDVVDLQCELVIDEAQFEYLKTQVPSEFLDLVFNRLEYANRYLPTARYTRLCDIGCSLEIPKFLSRAFASKIVSVLEKDIGRYVEVYVRQDLFNPMSPNRLVFKANLKIVESLDKI